MRTTCPVCEYEVTQNNHFCPHCGASLAEIGGDTTKTISVYDDTGLEELGQDADDTIGELPEGSAMLMVVRGSQSGERFLIDGEVTTAGRHPRCDIFLDDITVSRHHARFTKHDGYVWVQDENSLNGTYVNQT
ncbi:MAG: FHA domain-containing protein, partial [Propionibacteriaceae bacterium]|nr:FHA domain-containing protein [Propionibacteriaceae bacterium]